MSGFAYLASPFSHPDPAVRGYREHQCAVAAAHLLSLGRPVFAPIVHNPPLLREGLEAWTADQWIAYDFLFLRQSNGLIVFTLPGWDVSPGVAREIAEAQRLGILIDYLTNNFDLQEKPPCK